MAPGRVTNILLENGAYHDVALALGADGYQATDAASRALTFITGASGFPGVRGEECGTEKPVCRVQIPLKHKGQIHGW